MITPAESSPRLRALGVPAPLTPTDEYPFELPVKVVDREGELATNFIGAWHAAHFAMEAKMSDPARNNDALLRGAFGQVSFGNNSTLQELVFVICNMNCNNVDNP